MYELLGLVAGGNASVRVCEEQEDVSFAEQGAAVLIWKVTTALRFLSVATTYAVISASYPHMASSKRSLQITKAPWDKVMPK